MKLQIQVAAEAEAENLAFFHPDAAWPSREWMDLGTINLSALAGDDYIVVAGKDLVGVLNLKVEAEVLGGLAYIYREDVAAVVLLVANN